MTIGCKVMKPLLERKLRLRYNYHSRTSFFV